MRVLAVTNIYPSSESPASGVFIEQQIRGLSNRLDIDVLFLDRRRLGPSIYYKLRPILRRKLTQFRPDLVHVMYGGVMAHQVSIQPSLPPLVVTFHGSDLLGENYSGWWRKLVSHYGIRCSRAAAKRAHGIIVVARHLLKALGRDIEQSKVRVVPCGIDLERFKPLDQRRCRERLAWRQNDFHVLFATSSSDPVKRPELARAAVAAFNQKRGAAVLHVLSGVANEDVPTWLNASDVLLLTSRHEGSPTIVKEALASGLPVVSVPVGDVPERIKGIDGCFLGDADPDDLARKLDLVYQRHQRLECREKLTPLSSQAVAAELERFYGEVLNQAQASQSSRHPCEKPRLSSSPVPYHP
jgi:glycosyltransferase involved in cell wall biosynthesis